jgi:thiosulfate/3-mercaptopyruvate sulfurtransferase
VEEWQKYLVSNTGFPSSTHGRLGCTFCHGGDGDASAKEAAHRGLKPDPSERAYEKCGGCHTKIAENASLNLHFTLNGYEAKFLARSHPSKLGLFEAVKGNHCSECHTTCGQCHVSRPTYLGGGLVGGHQFLKTPSMVENCTACHGRVGREYLGQNGGLPPDVHWKKAQMNCTACHKAGEMHGDGTTPADMHAVKGGVQCLDCHPDAAPDKAKSRMHTVHGKKLSCQVCHSVKYKNCYGCHVGKDEKGLPYRKTEKSILDFRIGLNPLPGAESEYVTVRHVPVVRTTFDFYAKGLLPNYDNVPTWKYTAPHTTQKYTRRNFGCNSCHGRKKFFLQKEDLLPGDAKANEEVIVTEGMGLTKLPKSLIEEKGKRR